tara:strand:+ start:2538 stop:2822 length:285 start_codon:yes stop_codon:yes gene_type:complete
MIGDILIQRSKNASLKPRFWTVVSENEVEENGKRIRFRHVNDKFYIKDDSGYNSFLEAPSVGRDKGYEVNLILDPNDPIEARILSSIIVDTHCV